MSGYTYYQYKDVKINIVHRLFQLEGWKVYGWHANNSDPYTDYYDPEYWDGIATKNGYTLVIDHSFAAKEINRTYKVYTQDAPEVAEKIKKLERMTMANGASEQEEQTARAAIAKLREKKQGGEVTKTEFTPGHLANPPRCNWHIEKDGIIVDKGTGLLKFADVVDITNDKQLEAWQKYNNLSKNEWIKDCQTRMIWGNYPTAEEAAKYYNDAIEKYALLDKFNQLINRFNTVCGGMVGNEGENGYTYELRKEIKYKKVWKFQPTESGSFKNGQCFQLKTSFNYARFSGYVYRFKASEDGQTVRGERVSMKSGKSLTGRSNSANVFGYYAAEDSTNNHGRDKDLFLKWIGKNAIQWGEVVQVSEPYEVEKYVKVDRNGNDYKSKAPEAATTDYKIIEDIDTRDNSKIFIVKLSDKVSREEFNKIREKMKSCGGYYSRFKKGFIFKNDPTESLKEETPEKETTEEAAAKVTEEATESTTEAAEETAKEATEEVTKDIKKPGYTGATNEIFTPEEIAKLLEGGQVIKNSSYWNNLYIATLYKNNIYFVYSFHLYQEQKHIEPRTNADYCGFIYNNKYYTDVKTIAEEAAEDINRAIIAAIPTEEAAKNNAASIPDYEQKSIDFMLTADYSKDALKYFINEEAPELILFCGASELNQNLLIDYIVNPTETIQKYCIDYMEAKKAEIYKSYIRYNRKLKALAKIRADKANKAHILKAINDAIKGGEQKSFRITLETGAIIKVEARAVRNIANCGDISYFYVAASDREHLKKNQYGHFEDIQPEEIKTIMHGTKILYRAA